MKQKLALGISMFVLAIIGSTLVYSSLAGNPPPFHIFPEETGEHDGDHQFPDYQGSIPVNDDEGDYSSLAVVTQADAELAALEYTTGGSVVSATLENENGYLVWNVVVSYEGVNYEIIIDAGNGSVLWASSGEEDE